MAHSFEELVSVSSEHVQAKAELVLPKPLEEIFRKHGETKISAGQALPTIPENRSTPESILPTGRTER